MPFLRRIDMITTRILELVEYGLVTGLIRPEDKTYTINSLMELFQLDDMEDAIIQEFDKRAKGKNGYIYTQEEAEVALEEILEDMMAYA